MAQVLPLKLSAILYCNFIPLAISVSCIPMLNNLDTAIKKLCQDSLLKSECAEKMRSHDFYTRVQLISATVGIALYTVALVHYFRAVNRHNEELAIANLRQQKLK